MRHKLVDEALDYLERSMGTPAVCPRPEFSSVCVYMICCVVRGVCGLAALWTHKRDGLSGALPQLPNFQYRENTRNTFLHFSVAAE